MAGIQVAERGLSIMDRLVMRIGGEGHIEPLGASGGTRYVSHLVPKHLTEAPKAAPLAEHQGGKVSYFA